MTGEELGHPYRTREELEARRFQAAEMFRQGASQARIAERFGITRAAASRWARAFRKGGRSCALQ
jgi:transposase